MRRPERIGRSDALEGLEARVVEKLGMGSQRLDRAHDKFSVCGQICHG